MGISGRNPGVRAEWHLLARVLCRVADSVVDRDSQPVTADTMAGRAARSSSGAGDPPSTTTASSPTWTTSSRPPAVPAHSTSSYYFYWIQTEPEQRDALALFLREHDVYTTFRYYPLHLVERYGSRESLPKAEAAAHSTLCIPIHQAMTDGDVAQVVDASASFFRKSGRLGKGRVGDTVTPVGSGRSPNSAP
jgi:DegT/DnrJ/EryC1/StrS aminotransferase family